MSGSALSPWALVQEPSRYAAQVAVHANCSPELPHPHLLKCLREKPLDVLLSTPIVAPEFSFAFGPSVDGVVIDTGEQPGEVLRCWGTLSVGAYVLIFRIVEEVSVKCESFKCYL